LPGPYGATDVSEGMKIIQSETNPNVLWLLTSLFPYPGYEYRYVIYRIENSTITYWGYCDMGPTKMVTTGGTASPMLVFVDTEAGTTLGVTKIGIPLQNTSSVSVVDFDNANGQFLTSTLRTYLTGYSQSIPSVAYADFSPNGRFLYFSIYYLTSTTNGLYQIDLQDPVLSAVQVHTYNWRYAGGISLAPDSLIYHIYDGGGTDNTIRIGRILTPDDEYVLGVTNYSTFYQENYITFNSMIGYGFCNYLFVSKDVLVGELDEGSNKEMNPGVFPVPTGDRLYFSVGNVNEIEIFNNQGSLVLRKQQENLQDLDVSGLNPGIYYIRVRGDEGVGCQKFVKK
jgi:hypothetical protein